MLTLQCSISICLENKIVSKKAQPNCLRCFGKYDSWNMFLRKVNIHNLIFTQSHMIVCFNGVQHVGIVFRMLSHIRI